MVFQQVMESIFTCFNRFCFDYGFSLKLSQVISNAPSSSKGPKSRVRSPPQRGYFKLNTDGSWVSMGNAGAGGIIRCHKGKWQFGYTMKIIALEAASTELIAIREGLTAAWDKGIRYLELETDAEAIRYMIENPHDYFDHQLAVLVNDLMCSIA
uniref:RNase H type-1 domain-containing protein n=1 Tax=Chenopodium quinoa TaxID=63459 RepID=A0A803LFE4_CHEQI